MRPRNRWAFLALALLLSAGCQSESESAKEKLQELKNDNKIAVISGDNFVYCAQMGDRIAVHLYVESGMDINVRNKEGRTPLMGAAAADPLSHWFDRNEEITRYLISHKADVNAIDNYGNSAFKIAKNLARLNIVKILADAGAKEFPLGPPTPTPPPEAAPVPMM